MRKLKGVQGCSLAFWEPSHMEMAKGICRVSWEVGERGAWQVDRSSGTPRCLCCKRTKAKLNPSSFADYKGGNIIGPSQRGWKSLMDNLCKGQAYILHYEADTTRS